MMLISGRLISVSAAYSVVDAEADEQSVFLRLEVDVGRAVLGRLEDHRVDETDERRVGDAVVDLEVVALLLLLLERELLFDRGPRAERLGGALQPTDLAEDVLLGRDAELHLVARRDPQ